LNGSAKVFFCITVSDCQLNSVRPVLTSFAQYGTSPQRIGTAWRSPSFLTATTRSVSVGRTTQRGGSFGSSGNLNAACRLRGSR
jgi:hypothetical protein